jgi:hypothetical protein
VFQAEPDESFDIQLEVVDGGAFVEGGADLRQCDIDCGALRGAGGVFRGAHAFAPARGTGPVRHGFVLLLRSRACNKNGDDCQVTSLR